MAHGDEEVLVFYLLRHDLVEFEGQPGRGLDFLTAVMELDPLLRFFFLGQF